MHKGCARPGADRHSDITLSELVNQLVADLDELREQGRFRQRGSERIRTRGAGAKGKPTTTDRLLTTALYLRKLRTRDLLSQLFEVTGSTLTRAIQQSSPSWPRRATPLHP
jgi:hypothetical protein